MKQTSSNTPIFDSHIHLFRGGYASIYSAAFANRDEVALYESLRAVHNIEGALVVGFEGETQFEGNNRDLQNWSQEHDWITPLEYSDVANPPDLLSEHFAGIALFVSTLQDAQKLDDWPRATTDQLNARRSIISLNAEPEVLGAMQNFLASLEDCHVLISHCGSPGAFREVPQQQEVLRRLEPLRRLRTLPHVGVKVSGLYAMSEPSHDYPHCSTHPFLHQLRDDFGTQRLFWGSDFSPALEHVSFAQTIDAISHLDWPPDEVARIMGGNLKQLLSGES